MEKNKDIYILGIESSCDDTSAAVLRDGVLLSNVTASQDVHKAYGGVVPELASRDHVRKTVPPDSGGAQGSRADGKDIDAVAYTAGPGRWLARCWSARR